METKAGGLATEEGQSGRCVQRPGGRSEPEARESGVVGHGGGRHLLGGSHRSGTVGVGPEREPKETEGTLCTSQDGGLTKIGGNGEQKRWTHLRWILETELTEFGDGLGVEVRRKELMKIMLWFLALATWFLQELFIRRGEKKREGNGNPLLFSWLENPRDRGAWWAAIYGVAQSWT